MRLSIKQLCCKWGSQSSCIKVNVLFISHQHSYVHNPVYALNTIKTTRDKLVKMTPSSADIKLNGITQVTIHQL